ncbi:MAG: hypothetical protein ACRCX8_20085 [Sarcina sp.]
MSVYFTDEFNIHINGHDFKVMSLFFINGNKIRLDIFVDNKSADNYCFVNLFTNNNNEHNEFELFEIIIKHVSDPYNWNECCTEELPELKPIVLRYLELLKLVFLEALYD